ncbi:serine hydrolase domain-containing protein [Altererythrobacter xiamenensis]|uniref:serine hydrolase domain-containing protein n=1 Tax=Altererythrobacter xiamenensis TaxID=1316679 RepID=UPI00117796BB|nr:serine hydrolase domain-containing protein [Altererythrobacter xiamenensis]
MAAKKALSYTLTWLAVGLLTLATQITPLRADPPDPAQQHHHMIAQIEQGLRPPLAAKGEPHPVWSLEERMEHHDVPAISIAVALDGEVVWAKAYGVAEKGSDLLVDENTLFQAASLSKPVAALAALSLVDKGQLDLDSPVGIYLRSWDVPDNSFTQSQSVTLRHLLSHRAGTTIHGFRGYKADAELPSSAQILEGAEPANTPAVTIDQVPGTARRYSGGGYQVVQLLLEDLTGKPFAQVVAEEVFAPAGLVRSNYDHIQSGGNVASGHVGGASDPITTPGYFAYPELAAAGIWTTPTELLQLGSQVARARQGHSELISDDLALQMVPSSAD